MGVLDGGLHRGAIAEGAVEREIVGGIRPDRRRPARERFHDVGHRRQDLVLDDDRFGGIARGPRAFRDDDRDRLADKTHAAERERRLQLVEDFSFRRRREGRDADVVRIRRIGKMRHADVAIARIVLAGEHGQHARPPARG